MQTRYRAAATALLLTATAGLAATAGAAEASGTHHATARAARSLTVTVRSTATGPKLSTSKIRPGFTTFKFVRKAHGSGGLEVFRLRSGYTLAHLKRDLPKITGEVVKVKAVRRIDKNVVFYGGGDIAKSAPVAKLSTDIASAGKYFVANVFKGQFTSFKAKGSHERRSHPHADGFVNMARGNVWSVGKNNPAKGWMRTTNHALEPHFVEFDGIADSASDQDVADWFNNPSGPPTWMNGISISTEVVSPGHTVYWKYSTSAGRYAVACFYPSKSDGTPHAFMGMFKVTSLG